MPVTKTFQYTARVLVKYFKFIFKKKVARRALIGYSNSEYALLFTPETRSAFASDNIEVFAVRRSQLFVLYYFIALVYT